MNVGFYYMANAGGTADGDGAVGLVYQTQGLDGVSVVVGRFRAGRPAPVHQAA